MRGKGNASYVEFFNGIEEVWSKNNEQFNERYLKN